METDSSSFPSSFSSAAAQWNYDVFLSFRGEDTRYNFVGHLYEALIQKGIHTFKDDKNLDRGKPISSELLNAIKVSRFAIVIISKDYASSTWCLDELAHIIHCKNETGMTVLPVFHYVDPSNVRKQEGTFLPAFIKHEQENKERVDKWRDALREVGNLAGFHLKNTWYETEDIKEIMGWISLHLKYDAFHYFAKDLVGINSRMEELESRLALGSNDVRFIGVWGMGGMGKTTLARVVYYMVSSKFEACSFIEDVRENSENSRHGLVGLQQKLISNILEDKNLEITDKGDGVDKIRNRFCRRRILLVLDDVNKLGQLKVLAGEHDWFGPGSRIIITTRDVHVLKTHGVDKIYEVKGLYDKDAFQLFCSKAFKKDHVPDEYLVMFEEFLKYAAGLPLAVEVLGSSLFDKNTKEWKSALKRLEEYPDTKILDVLKVSYDGLPYLEKEIFLYIACFFNHMQKDHVVDVLDSLGLYPDDGLKELINKSLLKIDNRDILRMHDLLEELGKNIVREQGPIDCGKRSRLWKYEDIKNVLKNNKGIEEVQAMQILPNYGEYEDEDEEKEACWSPGEDEEKEACWSSDEDEEKEACWSPDEDEEKEACWSLEAISQMHNLKFLGIEDLFQSYSKHRLNSLRVPNSLRVLCWRYFPLKSLPSTFQLDELVMLYLPHSGIEQLWIGRKKFHKLKIISLSYSNLMKSLDFTAVPNLEKLTLSNCQYLRELHLSIGILKKLVLLDLANCGNLGCLPSTICKLKSLESLQLSGCSNFKNLPENLGNVKSLKRLDLRKTAIKELPSSIEHLPSLTYLDIHGCQNLVSLPNTTCGFKFNGALDLSTCSRFKNLPENPWIIEGLDMLNLSKLAIEEMPSSIGHLTNLTTLTLRSCKNLVCLPSTICSLKSLESLDLFGCSNLENLPKNLGNVKGLKMLDLSGTAVKELPSSIGRLTSLTSLDIHGCKNLVCLPSTICSLKSLESLDLSGCSNFDNLLENLGNVKGLKMLDLSGTAIKELPSSIGRLTSLTSLNIHGCKNLVCLPSTICSLNSLESLDLSGCSNFDNLPENLGNVKGLKMLDLSGTPIKELPSSIERLTRLTSLNILDCKNLVCLPNTSCGFKFHGAIDFSECLRFKNLPENPWIIEGLEKLNLNRTAIEGLPSSIDHLTNLTLLTLRHCVNLVHLPSTICSLKLLNSLDLFGCLKFDNLPKNIGNMEGLEVLNLCWTAIKEVPSSIVLLKNLRELCIRGWKLSEFYSHPESPEWPTSFFLPTSPTMERILLPSYLSNCDLSSIPNDIGCLSSLKCLDLSGNNFVSLPKSMSQLSNLRSLCLEGCKRLQSLENVPSTIESIIADNCISLERLPKLQYYHFRLDRADLQFLFFNCFKLVDNSVLQADNNMLQGQSGTLPKKLKIIIPGSEIPKYFNHECTGHEVNIQVPSNLSNALIGIAFCVVFVPNNWLECPHNWMLSFIIDGIPMYSDEIFGSMKKYDTIESHHLWLTYNSYPNGCHPLMIRAFSRNLKVEKIGVRFIYQQDIEIPSKTMEQCINNSSIVVHHDIDDSIVEGSGNKLSRDEDDGAGPSGECCSIVEPQPKKIQRLGGFLGS